jgi:tetratricopeptide (TPR) repeat protein
MSRPRNLSDRGRLISLVAVVSLSAACAGKVVQSPRRVADLDREAVEAYQAGELPHARALLTKAVTTAENAGLEDDPVTARAYLDLGAVHLAEGDRSEALGNFGIALSIDPDIEPSPDIVTPTLKQTMAVARIQLKRGRGSAMVAVTARKKELASSADGTTRRVRARPARDEDEGDEPRVSVREPKEVGGREGKLAARSAVDAEPDPPANLPQPLYCPAPEEAPPEAAVPMRCVSSPTVAVSSVVLFYRPAGSESFTRVPMVRSRKGWYRGVVPASALVGKTLQYYVEALGPAKNVATTNGQADSPNLMIIRPGAALVGRGALAVADGSREPALEVDEDPLVQSERLRAEVARPAPPYRRRSGAFWVGLGLGSGVGWHPIRNLEFRTEDKVQAGFSPAGLMQVTPEIGWQWHPEWAVSLQSRHQLIPESGSGDDRQGAPAHGANAVLLRVYRYFGGARGQPFVSGAVGGGDGFRLVVPPHPMMNVFRNDTVRGGPFLIGPGVGYLYNFNAHFAWAAEARALIGLPDSAALVELSTGAQLAF